MSWKRFTYFTAVLALMVCLGGTAIAETHTEFVTGNPITGPVNENTPFIIGNYVDFADLNTPGNRTAGIVSGVTPGDTIQLLEIPAGTYVMDVGVRIASAWSTPTIAAATSSCSNVAIGDGSSTSGWFSMDWGPSASGVTIASMTSGVTFSFPATVEYSPNYLTKGAYAMTGGKYYSAADTIDAVIPAANSRFFQQAAAGGVTDLQLQVWAICVQRNTNKAYGSVR